MKGSRMKWIDKKFSFNFSVDCYQEIIERLRGTPARIENLIKCVPKKVLKLKQEKSWSIQEHIGHLVCIESLMAGRLDDFESGKKELRAAEITNRQTEKLRYNEKQIELILRDLRKVRKETIVRVENLKPDDFSKTAFHPRLQVQMRLIDVMYFFAEHDDYHIERISNNIKELSP